MFNGSILKKDEEQIFQKLQEIVETFLDEIFESETLKKIKKEEWDFFLITVSNMLIPASQKVFFHKLLRK